MKIFKFLLVIVTNFLFFFSQSALAEYGQDDVPNDTGEKTRSIGAEVEINEFVLLDSMPYVELYYYPYSADNTIEANGDDAPGSAGSVFVGGGVIKWHANIDTTISIDDFTLTHTDTSLSERNEVPDARLYVNLDYLNPAVEQADIETLSFDNSRGPEPEDMGSDMTQAYNLVGTDSPSYGFSSGNGYTDFAAKYYMTIRLADAGYVQQAGIYQASATVRAAPSVSN
ncbi:hypothetical protein N9I32_04265 [Porticoccaceae bacterium]|nr:hypothetical protein [Porticoccaceae bacterium]